MSSLFQLQQNGDGKKTKKGSGVQNGQHCLKLRNLVMSSSDVDAKRVAKQDVNGKLVGMNVLGFAIVRVNVVLCSYP